MTLIDLITAQSARLKQAGVSFGHGTTNAFDEAAWLVLWSLGLPMDALERTYERAYQAFADVPKPQRIVGWFYSEEIRKIPREA